MASLCVQDVVLREALRPIRRRQSDGVRQLRREVIHPLTERGLHCPLQASCFHLLLLHVCKAREVQVSASVSEAPPGRHRKPAGEIRVAPSQTCRTAEQETVPKELSATHLKWPESSGKASVITRVHSSSAGGRMNEFDANTLLI